MSTAPTRARVRCLHADNSRWELATRQPSPLLRPFLRDWLGYSEQAPGPVVRREFPAPQVVVIIEFGPPLRVFDAGDTVRAARHQGGFVAGLGDRFSVTEHQGHQRGLQLNFTPIGARRFFGIPMSELTDRVVPLRDLLPREHQSLAERLEGLPDWDARFDLVEEIVTRRVLGTSLRTEVVAFGARRIEAGAIDIRALAGELGYSQKHLISLFRQNVGVPPGRFARLVRFDRLVRCLKAGNTPTWAALAVALGYYDQAHLAKDVMQFTGTTPTRARAMLVDLLGTSG